MQRDLYPDNWPDIRKAALETAKGRCEECRARHGRTLRVSTRTGNHYVTYLAVTHPDHDPWNPNARTRVLCQVCHQKQDRQHHQANAAKTRLLAKLGWSYRHGSVSNRELLGIARRLGIAIEYASGEDGQGIWTWQSEITSGRSHELAYTLEQALYDLLATYREEAQR